MKQFTIATIIYLTLFSNTYAYDSNSSNTLRTDISIKEINVIEAEPLKKRKKSKVSIKKLKRSFQTMIKPGLKI